MAIGTATAAVGVPGLPRMANTFSSSISLRTLAPARAGS